MLSLKMALFAVLAATLCVASVGAMDPLEFGVTMGTKAFRGMCWYEFLKRLPDASEERTGKFFNCYINSDFVAMKKSFESQGSSGDSLKQFLGEYYTKRVQKYLPAHYSKCASFGANPDEAPTEDYSGIIRDGGNTYPLKGYCYCLISTLKDTYGDDGLSAISYKWKYSSVPWQKTINDRENENRARHGSNKLSMNKELTERAQRWADGLAKKCATLTLADHIQEDNPDYLYRGQATGESIAQNGDKTPSEDNSLAAANAWYEEIKDYPPGGYTGDGKDAAFESIGHYTAQVWKGSKQVGYGIGRREGCDKVYTVARYFPAGNMVTPNKFSENVLPLQ